MTNKNRSQKSGSNKPDEEKVQGVQPNPSVGQNKPDEKSKTSNKGNAAGQGNEGDEVMPAGRETPG